MEPRESSSAVVVTGAAGGIGSRTAAMFTGRGLRVVGLDRLSLDAAVSAHVLAGEHPAVASGLYTHLVADLTDPDEVRAALAEAAAFGTVRHVISIAGGADPAEVGVDDLCLIPEAAITDTIGVNLVAQMHLAQAALPLLRASGAGATLCFTSSVNATSGIGLHAYSAAKAGLLSLARTLAVSEGRRGLRVNVVVPGTVITPRTEHEWAGHPGHFDDMTASTAIGACATPADIAAMFVALALDLTAVTGQALTVDAGQTARWR